MTAASHPSADDLEFQHWRNDMVQCPVCRSAELRSHKLENVPFDEVAAGAVAARRSGRPGYGLSLLLVWAAVEVANRLRPDWKCLMCDQVF